MNLSGYCEAIDVVRLKKAKDPTPIAAVLDMPSPRHAQEWWDIVDRNDLTLIEASRRHYKSRSIAVLYPLYRLVQNPDLKILIVSETVGQAKKWLREIKENLEQTPKLQFLVPENKTKWTDGEIIVDRDNPSGDPSISTAGVGKSILGSTADLIICDDIVGEDNSKTRMQREKVKHWFYNVLSPILEPESKMVIICTPWHEDDLYSNLQDNPRWESYSYPAESEKYEGGVLWPEKWPLERLRDRKKGWGSVAYAQQYLLDLSQVEGGLVKPKWINYHGEAPPSSYDYRIGVDPSIGETEVSDYTGIVVVKRDRETNKIYVVDFDAGRWESKERLEKVRQMYNNYPQSTVMIEKTAMSADFIKMLKSNTMLPVKPITPGGRDKVARLNVILPRIEDGMISFHNTLRSSLLLDQLIEFPEGSHDDLVDALVYAIYGFMEGRVSSTVVNVASPSSSKFTAEEARKSIFRG